MAGFSGFGVKLYKCNATQTTTMTAIAEMTGLDGAGPQRETHDVTSSDSTGQAAEFIPAGTYSWADLKISMRWAPANTTQQAIITDLTCSTSTNTPTAMYAIKWNNATVSQAIYVFKAMPTDFIPTAPYDGTMNANATFKISGPVTVTTI